ncbi:hypothetical protein AMECASPLE_032105 [Ameca splendens]|uniref:Uncharacterized protein n=1 Tax=Ameca splendens TaxID=208324 RepID=A0ABV0Z4D1_9TELE
MEEEKPDLDSAKQMQGRRGAGVYLQWSTGERQGTPWTGCQSIVGQHRETQDKQPCTHPVVPGGNLERVIILNCGRKPKHSE